MPLNIMEGFRLSSMLSDIIKRFEQKSDKTPPGIVKKIK